MTCRFLGGVVFDNMMESVARYTTDLIAFQEKNYTSLNDTDYILNSEMLNSG